MKKIKLLAGLGTLAAGTSLVMFTMSCSSPEGKDYATTDISGVDEVFKDDQLREAVKTLKEGNNENLKNLLNQKTVLITTGGKVNDQSFNQSAWEAISKFSRGADIQGNTYYEITDLGVDSTQWNAYTKALNDGYKIWVLTGFHQANTFSRWLKQGNNKQRFIDEKIKVITVDWFIEDPEIPQGQILGLNFRTQEPTFVLGYSVAKFLGTYYAGAENKEKRLINTFGGGDNFGVTNFNYGFYEGVRQWNSDQPNNDTKVKSTVMSNEKPVTLDTGFDPNGKDAESKVSANVDKNAQVMLPVAGPLTEVALNKISARKTNQWIIGVDTDMSKSSPHYKHKLVSSAEKRIGVAVYAALIQLYGLSSSYSSLNGFLGNNTIDETKGGVIVNRLNKNLANFNVVGGYSQGFVRTSKSTLDDVPKDLEGKLNGKKLSLIFDELIKETWDVFFGEDKLSGKFETDLKPSDLELDAFHIKNVKYGSMTNDNMSDYFKPAVEEINGWDI